MASFTPSGIPIIDVSAFTSESQPHTRQAVAQQFAQHFPVNGCIGIRGHNIPPELLEEGFRFAKALFDLPYEEKMKAPHPAGIVPHRGYSGPGFENLGKQVSEHDPERMDFKESFEVGSEENTFDYNIWLPEDVLPGFRASTTRLYWALHQLSDSLLDALILSLNLPDEEADSIKALHTGHGNNMRLAHYFALEGAKKGTSRLGAHTDWTLFTLLFQDAQGGLEFEDRATGEFLQATPMKSVVYVNIGDMFQRISNDLYPSSLHRVVADEGKLPDRYSIPYFVVPKMEGLIEPAPELVKRDGKKVYEGVKYGQYYMDMFQMVR